MINGYRIRQVRELIRLTQVELADHVGTAQSTIAQIESGRFQPSDSLMEEIADCLGFPTSFFLKEDPPNFPLGSLLFRSHVKIPAAEKDEIYRFGQLEFEMSVFITKRVRNRIVLRLPQLTDEPANYINAAQLTRNALGLSLDVPIPHLVRAVEQSGVIVLALPKYFEDCDAYSLWVNVPSPQTMIEVKKPLVVLSGESPGDRLRFSLAHEIGHLVMHQSVRGTSREIEDEANKFAAELLLPEIAMRQQITSPVTLTSLSRLKPIWGVSIQALILRAHDLEIISDRQYRYLFQQLNTRGWKKEEPIQIQSERPRAIRQIAEIVYGNPINYHRLAQDLCMHPHFVKRMIEMYATNDQYSVRSVKSTEEIKHLFLPK